MDRPLALLPLQDTFGVTGLTTTPSVNSIVEFTGSDGHTYRLTWYLNCPQVAVFLSSPYIASVQTGPMLTFDAAFIGTMQTLQATASIEVLYQIVLPSAFRNIYSSMCPILSLRTVGLQGASVQLVTAPQTIRLGDVSKVMHTSQDEWYQFATNMVCNRKWPYESVVKMEHLHYLRPIKNVESVITVVNVPAAIQASLEPLQVFFGGASLFGTLFSNLVSSPMYEIRYPVMPGAGRPIATASVQANNPIQYNGYVTFTFGYIYMPTTNMANGTDVAATQAYIDIYVVNANQNLSSIIPGYVPLTMACTEGQLPCGRYEASSSTFSGQPPAQTPEGTLVGVCVNASIGGLSPGVSQQFPIQSLTLRSSVDRLALCNVIASTYGQQNYNRAAAAGKSVGVMGYAVTDTSLAITPAMSSAGACGGFMEEIR